VSKRQRNLESIGLDAIQMGVMLMPDIPDGKHVTGYGVRRSLLSDTMLVTVYIKGAGKRQLNYPHYVLAMQEGDVGEFVYQMERLRVHPTQALWPSLAALRSARLLAKNGKEFEYAQANAGKFTGTTVAELVSTGKPNAQDEAWFRTAIDGGALDSRPLRLHQRRA